jgi:hypothetical protein
VPTTNSLSIAKACRSDAQAFQGLADWYAANPDHAAYGDLAQTFADGTAQRLELIVSWLTWEADKREAEANADLLAAIR